eukprot:TRINITY_DN26340_c0_g1_i1.p1 TRINITY_DN26340_c0_g1~~TRINITY_DN26340_c0_g1_i1.p1  ORF type:complete len:234 (+),score=39.00 TRINITY_DN26340_c0_g1_i1:1076-1777(+)
MWFSDSRTVELSLFDRPFSIVQDNTTMHVGTTVWEASLVMAKWLEKNAYVAGHEFSVAKLGEKRALELGSGCGIAGFAMSLMGADTTLTDIPAVLPILKKNLKRNMTNLEAKKASRGHFTGHLPGKVKVAPLLWSNKKQINAVKPPYDFVVAADVVYLEEIVEPLIQTMLDVSTSDTVILLGYKERQEEAHAMFWELLPKNFVIEKVAREELDPSYSFEGVDLFILRTKPKED